MSQLRPCFVPRPGWVFISVDYGALELVTLSQTIIDMFGSSTMADAINSGQDLHTRLAAKIMGIDYQEAIRRKKAGDEAVKGIRQVAKITNFGVAGGMGEAKQTLSARKAGIKFCETSGALRKCGSEGVVTQFHGYPIAPTCSRCLELATQFKKAYLDTWTEMSGYFQECKRIAARAEHGEPLTSLSKGGLRRLEPGFCAVANHAFQNRAAVATKDALWRVTKECYSDYTSVLFNKARPVAFVHDEIFTETREELLDECARRQTKIMLDTLAEHCPDVKGSAEPASMRRWFKSAEATYDKNGRLKPWWPADWTWGPDQAIMKKDREA